MKWILLFVGLLAIIVLSITQVLPPPAAGESALPDQFSAGRALRHVEAIASEPRPIGSRGHEKARDYITHQLSESGLEWEIQNRSAVSTRWGLPFDSANVQNIVARLPGRASTRALILISHYDTVPNSPGAGDDASGVAAMLETIRALKAGSQTQNDIIFLFTDGEEGGPLGSKAFVDEHPNIKEIGLAANFDARGSSGVSVMFDTSPDNGLLIEGFSKSVPYPMTSSLIREAAAFLATSTDFRLFKDAGIPGMNFAFFDGVPYYHTPADSISKIDRRSLQHQGSYMLGLSRHFGNIDLTDIRREDAIYFNAGTLTFYYPRRLAIPLFIVTSVIFIGVITAGIKKNNLHPRGIIKGSLVFLFSLIAIPFLISCIWWGIRALHSDYQAMRTGDTYNAGLYRPAFVLLTAGLSVALYSLSRQRIGLLDFMSGVAAIWLILLGAATFFAPGASYIFLWPLLAGLIGIGLTLPRKQSNTMNASDGFIYLICSVPGLILGVPAVYFCFAGLQLSRSGVTSFVMVLLIGLLIPDFEWIGAKNWKIIPVLFGLAAAGLLLAASLDASFDKDHPRPTSLLYALDAASGRACWLSEDQNINSFTASFIQPEAQYGAMLEFFPDRDTLVRKSQTGAVDLPAPALLLLEEKTGDARRILKVKITSPRQAPWVSVFLTSDTKMVGASINGRQVEGNGIFDPPPQGVRWGFRHMGLPREGIELTLEVEKGAPIEITIVDQSFELLVIPGTDPKKMPEDMMPARSWIANSTLVRSTFSF